MKCLPKAIDVYCEANHPIFIGPSQSDQMCYELSFEIGAQLAFVDKSELLGPCYFKQYSLNHTIPSSSSTIGCFTYPMSKTRPINDFISGIDTSLHKKALFSVVLAFHFSSTF